MTAIAIIDLQLASEHTQCPTLSQLGKWVDATLSATKANPESELTIRIVDAEESHSLNHQYRGFDKPTNVLSFPFEAPPGIDINLLGDLVICAPLVEKEAAEQDLEHAANLAHAEVVDRYTRYLAARERIGVYEATWLPQAEQALAAEGYEVARGHSLEAAQMALAG